MWRVTRDYCEQLVAKKLDNLEEIEKFLNIHSTKTESGRNRKYEGGKKLWVWNWIINRKPPNNKSPGLDNSLVDSTKSFSNSSEKSNRRKHFQTPFMRSALPWYQKQTRTVPESNSTAQHPWWIQKQKSSTKCQQTEFNIHSGFPGGSVAKNLPASAGHRSLIPGPEGSLMPQGS